MNKRGLFDIETNGLLDTVSKVHCAVVKDIDTGEVWIFDPTNIGDLCARLDSFDTLIGHNISQYDLPVLRRLFGWEYQGALLDTLIMSRFQRPERELPKTCPDKKVGPHSLEAWGYRVGRGKVANDEWAEFTPLVLERCKEDVEINHLVFLKLLEEGAGEGWEKAHRLNSRLMYLLQKQEEYGWLVDVDHIHRCIATLNRWIDRIDRALASSLPLIVEVDEGREGGEYKYVKKPFKRDGSYAAITERWLSTCEDKPRVVGPFSRVHFRPIDLDKNAEVKEFLLDQGWEPEEWNYNSDNVRTSPKLSKTDEFVGIRGAMGRLIARRVQCKQRRGILEGWLEIIRPDGRIASQHSGMATTGRLKHKGIVNVPSPSSNAFFGKQMRQVFTSAPGYVLVGCDSAGNQIRQLAARMDDPDFTNTVLHGNKDDGTDLHSFNQKRTGVASRNLAKNFFYGFLFGAGDAKIGKIVGGGTKAGRALKEEYLNKMPKLRELLDRITAEWRATAKKYWSKQYNRWEYRDGYIKGIDGRPILVESEHALLVYFLQSDEAIQMAVAYCWLYNKLIQRGYKYGEDFGFVCWMHDEFTIECKEHMAQEVAELAEESIAWAGRFLKINCPHEGEAKIGKNWLEIH